MNHNGFTLIELLITMGIIALLSTVIVINMVNQYEKNKASQYEKFKETITSTGCSYIDSEDEKKERETCKENKQCDISISTLISAGLIDENLIDPSNNKIVKTEQKNIIININWENNDGYLEKECTFSQVE